MAAKVDALHADAVPAWAEDPECPFLGKYLLGPELGQGGMGRVVEGWDYLLRRRVAIKLLRSEDTEALVRFFREAKLQARLKHPHICGILDLGDDPRRPYLVLPLIQGPSLASLGTLLDPASVVRIMAAVADAVHHAHLHQLVHRDLKPANILVEPLQDGNWNPVVVDFGLARDLSVEGQALTWTLVGTPAFMSPEQVRCQPPAPSMDIYGLGATLFVLLSGQPPFEAATLAGLLTQQMEREPRSLRTLATPNPIARDLDTIVQKCLESDPGRRYPTAFALAEDLRRYLAGEPIQARRLGWHGRLWRRLVRHRVVLALAAAGLLAVLGLVTWNLHMRKASRLQVALAQNFGLEVKDLEYLLQVERMLPPHDMRPVTARVREGLEQIRQEMGRLGAVAQGPGKFALGRGLLALRDYRGAREHLEAAWELGFRNDEVATALGIAHAQIFISAVNGTLGLGDARERKKQVAELERTLLEPAMAFFRRIQRKDIGIAFMLRVLEANVDRVGAATSLEACAQSLQDHPWDSDRLRFYARALWNKASWLRSYGKGRAEELAALLEQSREALERAHAIARSDVQVHRELIQIQVLIANMQSENGSPSQAPFLRGNQLFEEAQRIDPDQPDLWAIHFQSLYHQLIQAMSQGVDTRLQFRHGLAELDQVRGRLAGAERCFTGLPLIYRWYLGESLWRRGEDPRPVLEPELALPGADEPNSIEANNVLMRFEAQHGLDLTPRFRRSLAIYRVIDQASPNEYYLGAIIGEAYAIQAAWCWWTGRDPMPVIRAGLPILHHSMDLQPSSVFAPVQAANLHALEARVRMAHGEDAGPAVRQALQAGSLAASARKDYFKADLALIEAHHVQGLWLRQQGLDPARAFKMARATLEHARRCNPTDWRIALAEARLELDAEGDHQATARSLGAVVRAAERGLAIKPDASELWWARAEALHRLGDGRAGESVRKALKLCPGLAPAKVLALAMAEARPAPVDPTL